VTMSDSTKRIVLAQEAFGRALDAYQGCTMMDRELLLPYATALTFLSEYTLTERQAAILRSMELSGWIHLWTLGERVGLSTKPSDDDMTRESLARYERDCLQLVPDLESLESRGFLEVDRRVHDVPFWRFSSTVRGRAVSFVVDFVDHPDEALVWHHVRPTRVVERLDDSLRILNRRPRRPLLRGEPGEFYVVADRVDDVCPTDRVEVEPWSDTEEWYRIHDWVGYLWQREAEGRLRGEREVYHRGGKEHLGPPVGHIGGHSRSLVSAAERVFRMTGARRVALHRCLPSRDHPHLDLEFVGRPA
jgi:hypothetical protein